MTRTNTARDKPIEKKSFSIAEAAASSGLSVETIRQAIAHNELIASYGGPKKTKPVILTDEFDRWLRWLPTEKP